MYGYPLEASDLGASGRKVLFLNEYLYQHRGLDKSGHQVNSFLISRQKHMLWVLIRSALPINTFWFKNSAKSRAMLTTYILMRNKKNILKKLRRHALSSRWLWTFNQNTCENRLEEVQGSATSSLFTPPLFQNTWPCVQLLCAERNAPCQ